MEPGGLFSSGLIAVLLLACPFTSPEQQGQNAPPYLNPGNPPPPPSANALPEDRTEQQWALITKQSVEAACLSAAREEAKAQGYSEALVFSCGCSAQESAGYKSYNCEISAADGAHSLSAACTKSEKSCTVNSEQGTVIYTFEEIAQLWS